MKKYKGRHQGAAAAALEGTGGLADKRQRCFRWSTALVLAALGLFLSCWYWEFQAVPNSDFPAFSGVAHEIFRGEMPTSFKRVPLWGMLHVSLGWLAGGPQADLTGGLIWNGVFHIGNMVLLYLLGSHLLGKEAGGWYALLAGVNPYALAMVVNPIVETCLLFFTLLTLYLIIQRSRWAYAAAAAATMVRYEAAGLIAGLVLAELLLAKDWKKRLGILAGGALSALPLAVWLILTRLYGNVEGSTHYLKFIGDTLLFKENLVRAWETGIETYVLLVGKIGPRGEGQAVKSMLVLAQMAAIAAMVWGVGAAVVKRDWKFGVLALYLILYYGVHSMWSPVLPRYYAPAAFGVLLWFFYGMRALWLGLMGKLPKGIHWVLWGISAVIGLIWILMWSAIYSKVGLTCGALSPRAGGALAGGLVTAGALLALGFHCYRGDGHWGRRQVMGLLTAAMLMANHFTLCREMGDGGRDIEFKRLAQWYIAEAKKGEPLVTSMAPVVQIFAQSDAGAILHVAGFRSATLEAFAEKCYARGVAYVAWDSRTGFMVKDMYYEMWGMQALAPLVRGKTVGAFEYVTTLRGNRANRFVHLYRLRAKAERQ